LNRKIIFKLGAAGLFIISFFLINCGPNSPDFDLVIKDGIIIDGTGGPAYTGDVAIQGDRIVQIGTLGDFRAKRQINVQGLIVAPGFIDVHTHCDRGIVENPSVTNYILQGVTTVIGGNCGGHPYPLADLFTALETKGTAPNFGSLIGHNTIRSEVMGYRMDLPTSQETLKMKSLIRQEMEAGGLGFSTGLSYLPGIYSNTQELIELASAVAPYQGIYASHIRDQAEHITEAIKEAIQIGEENGIQIQISHIKLADDSIWGELERITVPVEAARNRGVRVFLDQYPYIATSSGFTSSLPSWAFDGGRQEFFKRLSDKDQYLKIKDFIIQRRLTSTRGIDRLSKIFIADYKHDPGFQGKNLKEILLSQGKEANISNAADLILEIEKNGGASGVFFQMDEADVEKLMQLSYNMIASDGAVRIKGEGIPHPRNYGTFPRVLSHYCRNKNVLSLEDAVKKMTSLPAETFSLHDRGSLKPGMYADITIFDYESIQDNATFGEPHQNNIGIIYVLVNGKFIVEQNAPTGELPGMVIYGAGKKQGEKVDN